MESARELLEFIGQSVSPAHVVDAAAERLKKAGFAKLFMESPWELRPGGKYFVSVYGSALLAFTVGKKRGQLRMAASHTDFPCFRVKPAAGIVKEGYGSLNVEGYGGLMLRTWLDRPLSLAGRAVIRTEDSFHPEVRLIDFARPLLTIPSLAIHMDREVNEKGELNLQKDMLPLTALFGRNSETDDANFFLEWMASRLGVPAGDILSYELSAYPWETGTELGLAGEFISSPRLDNLTSVLACLDGICAAETGKGVSLIALFDNEETGSRTKQGAGSMVLEHVLRRIYQAAGYSEEERWADIASGFLLSVDVAHGLHPNHADKSDPTNRPVLGGGVVLKQAASQAYAGDAEAAAVVRGLCEANEIPFQYFVNRSDLRGGATLGSIASAVVPIRTMDIGVPILAMHSARELMGSEDQQALSRLLKVFFLRNLKRSQGTAD